MRALITTAERYSFVIAVIFFLLFLIKKKKKKKGRGTNDKKRSAQLFSERAAV